jgi:hypothetical protein
MNINEEFGIPITHVELVRERTLPFRRVFSSAAYIGILHEMLDNSPVEQFVTLYLNNEQIVGAERTSIGQNGMVSTAIPEIFRGAILAGASHIVVGHNHTNDNPIPSDPDINTTDIVVRASILMNIPLIDHIIVSPDGSHYSMMEHARELEGRVMEMMTKSLLSKFPWDLKPLHQLPGSNINDTMGSKIEDLLSKFPKPPKY